MPYNATTVNLGDISTGQLVDWIYEAKDSTCDDSIWGDSGLSNYPETTTGGMRWWNDDVDRVVYEWADLLNPNKNKVAIKDMKVVSVESVEIKQDVEMSEDDLMELLEM